MSYFTTFLSGVLSGMVNATVPPVVYGYAGINPETFAPQRVANKVDALVKETPLAPMSAEEKKMLFRWAVNVKPGIGCCGCENDTDHPEASWNGDVHGDGHVSPPPPGTFASFDHAEELRALAEYQEIKTWEDFKVAFDNYCQNHRAFDSLAEFRQVISEKSGAMDLYDLANTEMMQAAREQAATDSSSQGGDCIIL